MGQRLRNTKKVKHNPGWGNLLASEPHDNKSASISFDIIPCHIILLHSPQSSLTYEGRFHHQLTVIHDCLIPFRPVPSEWQTVNHFVMQWSVCFTCQYACLAIFTIEVIFPALMTTSHHLPPFIPTLHLTLFSLILHHTPGLQLPTEIQS
jgi:hypothetical protein